MERIEREVYELFNEFDDTCITVTDFDIHHNGARVDCLVVNEDGNIEVWCGNPFEDENCEELVLTDEERLRIYLEVLNNF